MAPFNSLLVLVLAIWTIPWKLYSVWLAVKNDHKGWFVALILLNTIGILEIFYIFKIAKKSWSEVETDFKSVWPRKQHAASHNGSHDTHH